jgi:hypothetical protein
MIYRGGAKKLFCPSLVVDRDIRRHIARRQVDQRRVGICQADAGADGDRGAAEQRVNAAVIIINILRGSANIIAVHFI